MKIDKFWLVWNEKSGSPRYKHFEHNSAKAEAERLARNNQGTVFHVLEVVGSARKQDVEYVKYDRNDDGIPF